MESELKVVLKLKHKTDKEGIINIRKRNLNKAGYYYISLINEIPKISNYDFDEYSQRIKRSNPNCTAYNKIISQQLKRIDENNEINNKNETVIKYFKYFVNSKNTGTKIRCEQVLKKFIEFISPREDILFNDINLYFVEDYYKWLRAKKNLSNNTVMLYMRIVKSMINKAQEQGICDYYRHPFTGFRERLEKVQPKTLTEKELKQIIDFHIPLTDNLHKVRDRFVFQYNCNGMRVSDIINLKWGDISNDGLYFIYKMIKTRNVVEPVFFNSITFPIIFRQLSELPINMNDIRLLEAKIIDTTAKINELFANFIDIENINESDIIKNTDNSLTVRGLTINSQCTKEFNSLYSLLQHQIKDKHEKYIKKIIEASTKFNVSNIFQFRTRKVTEKYKVLADGEYLDRRNLVICYNSKLKDLKNLIFGKEYKLRLTSHVARHTFTSSMINYGADILKISRKLNHQKLTTTQSYISDIHLTKDDGIMQSINNKMFR